MLRLISKGLKCFAIMIQHQTYFFFLAKCFSAWLATRKHVGVNWISFLILLSFTRLMHLHDTICLSVSLPVSADFLSPCAQLQTVVSSAVVSAERILLFCGYGTCFDLYGKWKKNSLTFSFTSRWNDFSHSPPGDWRSTRVLQSSEWKVPTWGPVVGHYS